MSTTGTERDERLREARERAALIRSIYQDGGHLRPGALDDLTVLALDEEVTRLDAVVTAVREYAEARRGAVGRELLDVLERGTW